jgi:trimeric autotransporter adhesin
MLKIFSHYRRQFLALLILFIVCAPSVTAQSTGFTYQGRLSDNNLPANGIYDFEFKLFTALVGGTQDGTPRQLLGVTVTNGVFSVVVDFGAGAFPGADRFLEIAVRQAGSGSFITLSPRQQVNPTPYAIKSSSADLASFAINAQNAINATNATTAETAQNAANATNAQNATSAQNALQLGGVAASQFVQTSDSRLSDARNPLSGSANYIQNTGTLQATSNFNISGNGTAGGTLTGNIVSATSQYNIGIARVLSSPGSFNFFAGNGAGQLNTTGTGNSFFGVNAGIFNTTGGSNAFFGFEAGRNNNAGANNSYFGKDAGRSSTTGDDNAFFGNDAGQSNTTGGSNSFFGKGAGADNTTATGNSFFGALAGNSNTTGANNAFFGFEAGRLSDDAFNNSFFGFEAGESNVIGLNNAFFGFTAGKLNTGSRNSFFGSGAGQVSTGGFHNSFFGGQAGGANTTGDDNSFFGLDSGLANTTGSNNSTFGATANVGASNLTNATAIGAKAFVTTSNSLVLGQINGTNGATASTNVGIGTTAPLDRLHVNGIIRVITLGAAGSTSLCRNSNEQISTCSSSLRYKTNISPFGSGLNLVNRLQPITFNWKDGGMRDLGLGAEDVAAIEPLLVTRNDKGEVEGVKYDRIAVVLLNAVKEQQQFIQKQQTQIDELKKTLNAMQPVKAAGKPIRRQQRVSQKPLAQTIQTRQ